MLGKRKSSLNVNINLPDNLSAISGYGSFGVPGSSIIKHDKDFKFDDNQSNISSQ